MSSSFDGGIERGTVLLEINRAARRDRGGLQADRRRLQAWRRRRPVRLPVLDADRLQLALLEIGRVDVEREDVAGARGARRCGR